MKYYRWLGGMPLLLWGILATPLVASEGNLDQGWFLNACQQTLTQETDTPQTALTGGHCYGYFEGLRHAGEVANDLVTRPELWDRQL
ncbi:hypothetical protein [Nitrosococcus watsonii]|uniref:Uncharacterized protein n=1 Tax=Nitrosococcus watsoni (strain C-113) TaxID=105559 RepID=D8K9A8_NITWC|nr:hypothetical protein [Nitrosococcus watsonii]ADJ29251.1 conserved hypothetical protein [Nitrosococcus watsonii C-113]